MDALRFLDFIRKVAADLIWPPACILCRNYSRDVVCKECRTKSRLYASGSLFDGTQSKSCSCAPSCSHIYAAGAYSGAYKDAVIDYKFNSMLWIGKGFAELMYKMLETRNVFENCAGITFVPVSDKRFAERGFDQSKFIAEYIAEKADLKCMDLLLRCVQGTAQSKFNRKERIENSHERFIFNPKAKKYEDLCLGKSNKLLLVDDILTTGATLEECASLLVKNGYRNIIGAVIATGRKDI
ncbi:MAG: ComF family protein [Clostridia bacterium]|nr:ComF family protein [Clostridia bacterium]